MKVSPNKPFQLIYSLFQHEYLGYLFESFVVQLDDHKKLTFSHQNISSKNAKEFAAGLDDNDYKLIELMDSIQQESVVLKFYNKKIKVNDFFLKIYDKEKGNELLQEQISSYISSKRTRIFELLGGKQIYEMGNDGEPAWKKIEMQNEKASILFHFMKNEENTHYFPTIKHRGEKVEFQYKGAYIVCKQPAWLVIENKLFTFNKGVDGNKLKPFLNKKFIVIPKKVEETYYKKFVTQIISQFDVYAKGFEIRNEKHTPRPVLTVSELATASKELSLFGDNGGDTMVAEADKILFELSFKHGDYKFGGDKIVPVSVSMEKNGDDYIFHKVKREVEQEKEILNILKELGIPLKNSRITLEKTDAFGWLTINQVMLKEKGFIINQKNGAKKYYIGPSIIKLEVNENIDWFDVHAIVKFGEFEIPFKTLRKYILNKKSELELPNGEIAVIPEVWLTEYAELFAFTEETDKGKLSLNKHHLSLVQDLKLNNLAKVVMNQKLEKLRDFESIEDFPMPEGFKGELRPYQKAGYNWMQFLNAYNFGGCLADDMGLGKTVQTLTLLQALQHNGDRRTSLLVMPTSLVYNWQMEAKKFTPGLKLLVYTGTNRNKDISTFEKYDVVITSYGIARMDIDLLCDFSFKYVILDESQAIKNPTSNISKAVRRLNAKNRLILSGTPIENSTLDLWSQMSFINPGLLGSQAFFRKEFLIPIEKMKDEKKTSKLFSIIKPFILRRNKSQVVTELPDKIESVKYCTMSEQQAHEYEAVKSSYRNKILDHIENKGINKSQFLILQGLNKLRQIANHPRMVDPEYVGDSGKMEDVIHMISNSIHEGHKILIFSQFVKHLNIVLDHITAENIPYAYLDGSTKDRMKEVKKFQDNEDIRIFLISLKAGGLGLNLTEADYVFLLDPWWNPASEAQAVDRAHRIGQKKTVFTYKFITKDTVEEKILALQESKLKLARELITTEESFVKNLSTDDIASILA